MLLSTRVHELAPVLSIAIALLLPRWLSHDSAGAPVFGPEHYAVRDAVENVPYRIGSWVGRDIPIPEAAVKLLRPNAMLSREYRNLETGTTVDMLLVHCGDARDMLGHYPPVCYPSAGWVMSERQTESRARGGSPTQLNLGGVTIPARVYRFSRMRDWTSEQHIRIFNFFVLPDGSLTDDIDHVGQGTSGLGASIRGVAQIQVLTDANLSFEDAVAAASDVLSGMPNLFNALGVSHYE